MTSAGITRRRYRGRVALALSATLGAAATLSLAAVPAAAASEGEHCVYSVTTQEYRCYESLGKATQRYGTSVSSRTAGEIIGATVFEHSDYGGSTLTITVPEPCPKNDKVDFWLDLDDYWQNRISSVQAWSTCWVWLYPESGDRAGPFKENHREVGSYINDRTVTVGLS